MNEKMKKLVNEHAITILCVISIIALFMPMFSVVTSMDVWGETSSETMTISGFEVMQEDKIGMLLVVGPAILIAMNYVKQLQKYKGILAIAAPLVCIVSFIACMIYAKNGNITAGESGIFRVDVKIKLAFGGLLALLSYLATTVAGAVVYHNFTLDKAGLEKLKTDGANLIQVAQAKASEVVQSASNSISEMSSSQNETNVAGTPTEVTDTATEAIDTHAEVTAEPIQEVKKVASNKIFSAPKPQAKSEKTLNAANVDEVLALIERLFKMKEAGILTEEEFSAKKQDLLSEI